jgi:hypothetical protein
LENAGCARSAASGASTTSQQVVTCRLSSVFLRLTIVRRRNSTFSAGDTTTCRRVSTPCSLRSNPTS